MSYSQSSDLVNRVDSFREGIWFQSNMKVASIHHVVVGGWHTFEWFVLERPVSSNVHGSGVHMRGIQQKQA